MNRYSKSEKGVGRKPGKLLCFALFAAALFLLPATARADSGGTYDVTGTFDNGVTINSGSSFTVTGGLLTGASITTSSDGTFSCPADAPIGIGTCTLYNSMPNMTSYFGINNGSYYLVLVFPTSDLGTVGPFSLVAGGSPLPVSYIETDSVGSSYSALASGTAMSTPEPGTWLLMLSGIAGLFFFSLRRVHA
jgi:PEP-CTERM motif